MDLLVLGGTRFLGRALVEAALRRGHRLTLFNRGLSNPALFPEARRLRGERGEDLSALLDGRWDTVIDTSGYFPRVVRQAAETLSIRANRYVFISSLSVYQDTGKIGIREGDPLAVLEDETAEEITGETYGPLKAICERVVEENFPGRALIIRPGLIVGPHDTSDRFTYWPVRVAEGGEVLAPGRAARPVQFIDVRDLADWTLTMAEERQTGIFNANGPGEPVSMGHLLEICREASGSDARFTWVSEAFLEAQGVGAWMELPLWIPESDPSMAGFFAFDSSKGLSAGLGFRSVGETVRDTLVWAETRPEDLEWKAGLTRERERELLRLWHEENPDS